ncbi:MAG: hypothetical protein IT423_19535 [Pirellulaceae bacterium]|nr:hypothetical protein [Pirellulaceae bacterium]
MHRHRSTLLVTILLLTVTLLSTTVSRGQSPASDGQSTSEPVALEPASTEPVLQEPASKEPVLQEPATKDSAATTSNEFTDLLTSPDPAAVPVTESSSPATAANGQLTEPPDAEQPAAKQPDAEQPAVETAADAQAAIEPEPAKLDAQARAARIKDLLSLVKDNTLTIGKRENPAYFEMVKEVLDRSPADLLSAVEKNPRFNDLYTKPEKYRGELIHVSLNARRVLPLDIKIKNVANVTRLYEIWGWTEEAKAHMYCCVVPELPPGFPEDDEVFQRVELTGYFFKMQAYQPGDAAPNARNLVAPLVIGRVANSPKIAKPAAGAIGNWPLALIIGFGVIVMFRLMMHIRGMGKTTPTHRNYRRRSLEPIDPDSLSDGIGTFDRGLKIRNRDE